MIDRNQTLKIGAFVFIGGALLITSLFIFGGKQSLFRSNVTLHAHFEQVQGLNIGSVVSLSGIAAGNVQEIIFVPGQNKLDVVMLVDADVARKITVDSLVEMRTQGALGDKFVMITPGTAGSEPVKNGAILPVKPEADLISVISSRGSEANKVFDILEEVYKMTKALNKDNRTENMLADLREASALLKENMKEARNMMTQQNSQKITNLLERLDRIAAKVDRGEGTLGALINDPSLHDQLKSVLGGDQKRNSMKSLIRSSIQSSEK